MSRTIKGRAEGKCTPFPLTRRETDNVDLLLIARRGDGRPQVNAPLQENIDTGLPLRVIG